MISNLLTLTLLAAWSQELTAMRINRNHESQAASDSSCHEVVPFSMPRKCTWGCYGGVRCKCPDYAQLTGDEPECQQESRKFDEKKLVGKGCKCKVAGDGDNMEAMPVSEEDQKRGEEEAQHLFGTGAEGTSTSDPLYDKPPPNSLSKCATGNEPFEYFTGCKHVRVNGLVFDCRFGPGTKGKVMLLHGFPEWSNMWVPTMRALSVAGYQSVACNQRGYSPGAAPENEADYDYTLMRDDMWAIADAVGFDKFHLVAHDHGAVLGWWIAGSDKGKERIQSYVAMSIPHNDALSAGLFGPEADIQQQMGSQYFSMLVQPDAAYAKGRLWMNTMGRFCGFSETAAFQKAIWWYNGAMKVGVLAAPPQWTGTELWNAGVKGMAALRWVFGKGPDFYPLEGIPQKVKAGPVSMPVLYVCGAHDGSILCNRPYAMKTKDYVPQGKFHYLEVKCAHDPTYEPECDSLDEIKKVVEGTVNFIVQQSS